MSGVKFKPSAQMTFATVVEDKARLTQFLGALLGREWVFDLSDVRVCDSAGLALLIEARRLSNTSHKHCNFEGISPTIESLIRFCGVNELLLPHKKVNSEEKLSG